LFIPFVFLITAVAQCLKSLPPHLVHNPRLSRHSFFVVLPGFGTGYCPPPQTAGTQNRTIRPPPSRIFSLFSTGVPFLNRCEPQIFFPFLPPRGIPGFALGHVYFNLLIGRTIVS